METKFLTYDGVEIIKQYIDTNLESKADLEHGCHIPTPEPYNNARFLRNDNSWKTIMPEHIGAATQDHNHNGLYLRKYTLPNNIETNFNLLENLTLSGRGEPTTGANLVNAPWADMGPVGGFGVLTYLWSGYGTQMAWGYNSNRIYIRNKYYNQSINNSGQSGSFDTLMSYTLGLNAYDSTSGGSTIQRAVINGREVSNVIKLGKGTSGGSVTIHIPDGTLTIGLYVVAWKSDPKTILMGNLGSEYLEIKPTTNEGATGNPPYTITVTNSDYYTINIPAGVTQITLSTEDKSNRRVILFGVNAIAFSEAIWDNKWDSIALTSDIPVLTGGKKATTGKYVSGVTVDGYEINVTQADLPSLSGGKKATNGKYVSGVTVDGHEINVTQEDLPSLSGGKAATSGKYVSGVTVDGHAVTVTQENLPSLSGGADAVTGKYVSSVKVDGHAITVAQENLPSLSGGQATTAGKYVSGVTVDGYAINVTQADLPSLSGGADAVAGKYISAVKVDGHAIAVTHADLPSLSGGADAVAGKYISAVKVDGHEINVTHADLPSLSGGKAATSGKYVSAVTVNGNEINVTQENLPTSLPANGGNSDTVGNKSASDFMPAGDTTHGIHVTGDAQTWNGVKTFTSEVILSAGGTYTDICSGIETAFKTNRIMSNEIFANTIYLGDSNKDSKSDQSLVIKKYNGVSSKAPSSVSDLVTINTNGQITATGGFNGNCTSANEWACFPTNTTGLDFNNLNNVTGYFQYANHEGTNTPYINFTSFKDVGSIMQFGNALRKGQFVIGNRAYDYLNTAGKLTPEGLYFRKCGEGSDNKTTGSHPLVWDPWREIPMIDSTGNLVVTSLSSHYNTSTNNYGLTIPFNTNVTGVLKVNGKEVALADNIPEDVDLTSINHALSTTIPAQFTQISGQIEQINLDRQALGGIVEGIGSDVTTLKTNLNVTKGTKTNPIYFNDGVPTECTHVLEQSVTTASKLTDTNYYPNEFKWTAGTTEGPTGSLTGVEMNAVTFGAIPAATGKAYYDDGLGEWVQTQSTSSGIVTTEKQTFSGQKFFNDGIWLGTGEYESEAGTDAVKIHFGDTEGVWIGEETDDSLTITADVLNLNAEVIYYNGDEIAVKSDITGGGSTKVKSTSTKFYITGCTSSPTAAGITPSNFVANTEVNVQNGTKVYASGGFFQSSDITLKDIHENIDVDLDKLSQLNKIYFNYKYDTETTHIGIIAQELQKLYPELVSEDVETGKLSVEYDKLSVIALSAIDKLSEENKKLNEKLQNIENILKNKGIM